MCRRIFRLFFAFLAILLGTIGLLLFTIRLQVFNADFYKTALNDADIYPFLAETLDTQINSAINGDFIKEESEDESDSFGPELLGNLIREIIDQLDLETILQTTAENNLDNVEEWAAGKTEEPLLYFPKDELINSIDNDQLNNVFLNTFFKEAESQLDSLPECTSQEAVEKVAQEIDLANLDISSLECVSPEIKQQVRDEVEINIPISDDFNFMEEVINANFGNLEQETPLSLIKPDLTPEERASSLEQTQKIQNYISLSNLILLLVIAVSLLFALFAALLGTEKKYVIFFKIYFVVGLLLTIIASILTFVIGPNLVDRIPIENDNFPEILAEQSTEIITKVDTIAESIITGLFQISLMFGITILVLSLVFWIVGNKISPKVIKEDIKK